MNSIHDMKWLAFGAVIGWFAIRMVSAQVVRQEEKPLLPLAVLSIMDKNTGRYDLPHRSILPESLQDEAFKEQYFANDSLGG